MDLALLSRLLPVPAAILVGWIWGKSSKNAEPKALGSLVLSISVPALVVHTLLTTGLHLGELLQMMLAASLGLGGFALAAAAILRLLGARVRDYTAPLTFNNSGNMGLPVCIALLGSDGLALGLSFFAVSATLQSASVGFLFQDKQAAVTAIRSPLTWAFPISLICLHFGAQPPTWVLSTCEILGGAAVPGMLLMLGAALATKSGQSSAWSSAVALAVGRLALGLVGGLLVATLLGLQGNTRLIFLVQCAMPIGLLNHAFAVRYDRSPDVVASAIVVSTLLAFVSIPLHLAWLAG